MKLKIKNWIISFYLQNLLNTKHWILNTFLIALCLCASVGKSATNYVSKAGGHISPFANWENAATNIQAAIDVALAGDFILVNDGTYYPASQIALEYNIIVKSVNGAEKTIVNGNNTNRCFNVDGGSTLDGFTITNGYAYGGFPEFDGGGVRCHGSSTVKNCIIRGNRAQRYGGGVFCYFGGTVLNCDISSNHANDSAGGIMGAGFAFVSNCFINGNSAKNICGGIYVDAVLILDSIIINNFVTEPNGCGGGVTFDGKSILNRCVVSNNIAYNGGGIFCEYGNNRDDDAEIHNCLIVNNYADYGGAISGYDWTSTGRRNLAIVNSTICNNYATNSGGGLYDLEKCFVRNCIIYNNPGGDVVEVESFYSKYSCIGDGIPDTGNISNNPFFVNSKVDDYRLMPISPCINSGTNYLDWYLWDFQIPTNDFAGNSRVHAGAIDMGCFENNDIILLKPADILSEKSSFRIKWLSLSNDMLNAMFDIATPENFSLESNAFYSIIFGDLFVSSTDLPVIKTNKKGTKLTLKTAKKVEPKILLSLKKIKKGNVVRFLVKLKKADIALDFINYGVKNTNTLKERIEISIPAKFNVGKWLCEQFVIGMEYKSKQDKKASGKSLF